MKRREFIAILGGAAASSSLWPLGAKAQQQPSPIPRLGFLRASPAPDSTMAALRRGLSDQGYVEGQNYVLLTSFGDGKLGSLPVLAKALVSNGVDVILTDGTQTAREARAATDTIPIILAGGLDPVKAGLATDLRRPDRNVTGFTTQVIDLTSKMFEILRELVPGLASVAIINPKGAGVPFRDAEAAAAQSLRVRLKYFEIDGAETGPMDRVLGQAISDKVQGLVMRGSPFFSTPQRKLIAERIAAHRIPAIYETREFVELGGLVSYGTDFSELFRLAARYIIKVFKGAKIRDLPIDQANTFELVINMKTAERLGVAVPPTLIARADEVIE
jgi:putative ABC transport system substrate-binding protein